MNSKTVHNCSIWHRDEILKSEKCGCFHCVGIFSPQEIDEWTDFKTKDGVDCLHGQTALCPKCGIDSVIGSESGYPITEKFLKGMQREWF